MELIGEEKKAIENLKELAVYCDDYSLLDEEEIEISIKIKKSIQIALNLIEKQAKENEELTRLIEHKNGYTKALEKDLFENCNNCVISKQKVKEIILYLENINVENNESVKRFEKMRRNANDDFYKDSYQKSIHRLNAKIETRKSIIEILQDLLKGE